MILIHGNVLTLAIRLGNVALFELLMEFSEYQFS